MAAFAQLVICDATKVLNGCGVVSRLSCAKLLQHGFGSQSLAAVIARENDGDERERQHGAVRPLLYPRDTASYHASHVVAFSLNSTEAVSP